MKQVPKATLSLLLALPTVYASPEGHASLNLYCMALEDRLNETAYQASLAGLNFGLRAEWGLGVSLTVQVSLDEDV
jgi:secreted Zn-dependent insulinase-like peptidase